MLGSSRFCSATSSEPTLGVFHELCKCVWGDRLRRHQVLASWSVLVPCNLISPKFPMHKTKFASVMFRFRFVCILPVAFPPLSFLSTQVTKVQSRGQCGAVLCVKMHCLLWPWRIDLPCIHLETSGARCILRLLLYTPCPSTKTQTKLQYLIREHVCVCACSVCLWVVCWNWTQLVKGVKAKSLASLSHLRCVDKSQARIAEQAWCRSASLKLAKSVAVHQCFSISRRYDHSIASYTIAGWVEWHLFCCCSLKLK